MSQRIPFSILAFALLPASLMAGSISIPGDSATMVSIFESNGGLNGGRSIGQVFQVPAPVGQNVLYQFGFYVESSPLDDFDYMGAVYEWDNVLMKLVGSALYQSPALSLTIPPGVVTDTPINFTGLNVALNPLKTYVAFLTTAGLADDASNWAPLRLSDTDYAGGTAVYVNSDDSLAEVEAGQWAKVKVISGDTDLGFYADFKAPGPRLPGGDVPEPGTWALMTAGCVFLAARRWRN